MMIEELVFKDFFYMVDVDQNFKIFMDLLHIDEWILMFKLSQNDGLLLCVHI